MINIKNQADLTLIRLKLEKYSFFRSHTFIKCLLTIFLFQSWVHKGHDRTLGILLFLPLWYHHQHGLIIRPPLDIHV